MRTLDLEPQIVDPGTVRAMLADASARVGRTLSAVLALDPSLGDAADPRWYAPAVVAALDGLELPESAGAPELPAAPAASHAGDWASERAHGDATALVARTDATRAPSGYPTEAWAARAAAASPGGRNLDEDRDYKHHDNPDDNGRDADDADAYRVRVVLWPAQSDSLTVGDVPPGIAVVVEPSCWLAVQRLAPPEAKRVGTAASLTESPRRASVAAVAALGVDRSDWDRAVTVDAYYDVLRAVCAVRAHTIGDVVVLNDSGEDGWELDIEFNVRIELAAVATTPLNAALRRAHVALCALREPAERLARRVDGAVARALAAAERSGDRGPTRHPTRPNTRGTPRRAFEDRGMAQAPPSHPELPAAAPRRRTSP